MKIGIALLAATVLFVPPFPARAQNSCTVQDLGNAAQNTYNDFVNGQCGAALADPVATALTVYLTTLVGGMGSQSSGFCQTVTEATNWTSDAQNDVNNVQSALNKIDSSGQLASQFNGALSSVAGALADAAGIESAFTCACSVTAGLGQLFGDLGSCIESGLCNFAQLVANAIPGIEGCSASFGTTWVNCMQNPCAGIPAGYPCTGPGGLWPENLGGSPVPIQCNSDGASEVCGEVLGGGDGSIGGSIIACACPAPRHIVQHNCTLYDGKTWPCYTCDCPAPSVAVGAGCFCQNSGQPAQPVGVKTVVNPEGVACPPPLLGTPCPAGQINLGGKCITPCSNPSEGMTLDGACCDPSQVTSCGMCCPPGTTPDSSSGTCIPKQTAQ